MDAELSTFLDTRTPDFGQQLVWQGGKHRFQLRGYFTPDSPPDAFVLAGRALVFDGELVLVVQDADGEHILPGGRREAGESAVDAVHREVVEETGWSISDTAAFSIIHLHHETPRPVDVGHVIYPDFLWHVFVATPRAFDARARHTDGYELGATFRPIAEVLQQPLEPFQRALLETAVRFRASWAT